MGKLNPNYDRAVIDVEKTVGEAPITWLPILVLVLSFLVIMLDGYDLLCISFAAPSLAKELGIPVASFGPVFSAGYVGILVGGLAISPFSDKLGRKGILLISVAVFGIFSLLPIVHLSYQRLLFYRFFTGLGLAGAMPPAVALTSEYAPRRYRGLFVNLMFAGVATGGVLGGFLASRLIPRYGWKAAFWVGGLPPLILVGILWLLMPESITYLAATRKTPAYIARILNRIDARGGYVAENTFATGESAGPQAGKIFELFRSKRTFGTLLIWLVAFCSLFTYALTVSWLPSIMTSQGLPLKIGILGPVLLNLGGIIGTVLLGLLFSRLGPSVIIAGGLALASAGILILAQTIGSVGVAFASIFAVGLFLLGSINSTNALMAAFYPTKIRATGVGWALGMGRVGGVIGPAMGGMMLSVKLRAPTIFLIAAIATAVGAVAITVLGALYPVHCRPVRREMAAAVPVPESVH